jgi:small subunit ribosomal protein S21
LTIVRAQAGEPVEVLIRKFNKKVLSDGVLNELKKREFYEKPSVVRKREKKERARLAYNRRARGE